LKCSVSQPRLRTTAAAYCLSRLQNDNCSKSGIVPREAWTLLRLTLPADRDGQVSREESPEWLVLGPMVQAGLLSHPARAAFLQKRAYSLPKISSGADARVFVYRCGNLAVKRVRRNTGQQSLVASSDAGLFRKRLAANSRTRSSSLAGLNNLVGEAEAESLLGADNPSAQQQVASLFSPIWRSKKSGNNRRNESDPHLGVTKLSSRGGQREVAQGRHFRSHRREPAH